MFNKQFLCAAALLFLSSPTLVHAITITLHDTITVTSTREEKPQVEAAESISTHNELEIESVAPAHPAEILNRSAGVHVNNLGGEGHMTSIRQPITTKSVYLFLEDGIPTRPTGLFNHNGLYEINVPQAQRIEVIKGPGSALYGSDSIGGIINSITKPSPKQQEITLNPEVGSYGWKRFLGSYGTPINEKLGARLDLNITDNTGYRDDSDYKRLASTLRIDGKSNDKLKYKTIISYSGVEQSGVSSLETDDFNNDVKKNFYLNDVARRDVNAFRASTEISYEPNQKSLYTVTPFFRHNQMKLMPSWMLGYDPNDRDYRFKSYGLLAKYRHKAPELNSTFIAGIDVDYTPSEYTEKRISVTRDGEFITGTQETGRTNYDFTADQLSISPYVHTEWNATAKTQITAGLRYDYFDVDYEDKLDASVAQAGRDYRFFRHVRPESQELSYENFSPKLGLLYKLNAEHNLYANYRHSFRSPSIGRLFRAGSTANTEDLKPVKTKSIEIGTKGQLFENTQYNLAIYHMQVEDDIVNFIDGDTRRITNAGETRHKGIELSIERPVINHWGISTALSYSKQSYEDFTATFGFPTTEINFAGNEVGKAPRTMGNIAVQYQPVFSPNTLLELELEHLGDYYTDETNTQKYNGHNLLNLRAEHAVNDQFELYARAMNIADKKYSTYTSNQVGDPDIQYRPGNPRTFFVGLRAKF